jgi:HNH endonuclease
VIRRYYRTPSSPLECLAGLFLAGEPTECWPWHGATSASGYGNAKWDGRLQRAHRVAYIAYIAPIAEGADVHHLCRNKLCVNPAHLRSILKSEHGRLHGRERGRCITHCKRGHEFTPENTYVYRNKNTGNVKRSCRICDLEKQRARYHAAKAVA